MRTAILVDGGFYRYRAQAIWGVKTPKERANELVSYCMRHINSEKPHRELYRIFYYDCLPISKKVYHPFLKTTQDLSKTDLYKWTIDFHNELKKKRKLAIRLGRLSENTLTYNLKNDALKRICNGRIQFEDLTESDFSLSVEQKGVDMKIGLDISSLSYKKQVDQIVLISGDSDFVPAAKHARREGIDFILDPMWSPIKDDLYEHIDGLKSYAPNPKKAVLK